MRSRLDVEIPVPTMAAQNCYLISDVFQDKTMSRICVLNATDVMRSCEKKAQRVKMYETKAAKGKNKESGQDRSPNHKPFSNISAKIEGRILLEKVERSLRTTTSGELKIHIMNNKYYTFLLTALVSWTIAIVYISTSFRSQFRPPVQVYNNINETTSKPKKADGIVRCLPEHKAIQMLSLAFENSLSKQSKRISNYYFGCDWIDGYWVQDSTIKYGEGILSGYTHCHADHRQNCYENNKHSPHLGYRWVLRNKSCEAKRIRFTRKKFMETIQNKKIAFIGDSLTRNMFQSLACLLYVPYNKTRMVEKKYFEYRYPDYNVTIEFIKSFYLIQQLRMTGCDRTKKISRHGHCLDVRNVDPVWARRSKDFDILIFATGAWWEGDQVQQVEVANKSYHKSKESLNEALRTVMNHLSKPEFQSKELFWRCSEVSHFSGTCRSDRPSNISQYNAVSLSIQETVIHAVETTSANINLLDITRMSSYREDAHPSSQTDIARDCKHWCLPGVPDHWNEMWLNMLYKPS